MRVRYLILMRTIGKSGRKYEWRILTVGTIATRDAAERQVAELAEEWLSTEWAIAEVPE